MAKNSGPVRTVHARTTGKERDEMIATTKAEIEKKFGQGSIMRYGDGGPELEVEAIPTGALALDAALGIGGVPRGRIVEIYGPESSGKTTLSLEILAEAQAMGGVVAFIDAEHALDPTYAARIGVDIDEVLISQPDTGEQALEIVDMLVRSGNLRSSGPFRRHRCHRRRLRRRFDSACRDRGRDRRYYGRPSSPSDEPGAP